MGKVIYIFLVFVCFWIDFQVILHSHSSNSMLAAPLCYQPCQCFFILLELNWILTKSVPALLTLAALCASKKLLSWWVLILVILLSPLTYFCQISCHVCFSSSQIAIKFESVRKGSSMKSLIIGSLMNCINKCFFVSFVPPTYKAFEVLT